MAAHHQQEVQLGHDGPDRAPRRRRTGSVRLHVVTGKGGTGKTTAAAALAIALASRSRRTLLVEVEGRQSIARLFGADPLPYEEIQIATVSGGGAVTALAIDAEAALMEYLEVFYHLGVAGRALHKIGAIDFATAIAPGVRDVLLTGKIKEAVNRASDNRRTYDAVILDAPPTGRIGKFLNVTAEAAKLAKVGPIKTQSESVAELLRSGATAVHLVTLLEEMPVQEVADTLRELTHLGLPNGAVIVNNTRPPVLANVRITKADIRRGLVSAGLPAGKETVAGLAREGNAHQARLEVESALRLQLHDLDRPVVELPSLPGGVTRSGLDVLAQRIRRQAACFEAS